MKPEAAASKKKAVSKAKAKAKHKPEKPTRDSDDEGSEAGTERMHVVYR